MVRMIWHVCAALMMKVMMMMMEALRVGKLRTGEAIRQRASEKGGDHLRREGRYYDTKLTERRMHKWSSSLPRQPAVRLTTPSNFPNSPDETEQT